MNEHMAPLIVTVITETPVTLYKRLIYCFQQAKKNMVLTKALLSTPPGIGGSHSLHPTNPFSVIPLYQNDHLNLGSFPTHVTLRTFCCVRILAHNLLHAEKI